MALLGIPIRRSLAARCAALSLLISAPALAQAPAPSIEANLKAVFLFNFTKYVTWPALTMGERSPAELRICATVNDDFFARLKSAIQGEEVDGKPLQSVMLDSGGDASTCQILYVGDAQSASAKTWLAAVRSRQVLTVADGALNDDTVITFVRDDNRIRFDINRAAASRQGLNVSSKLLRLARQVRDR
jgi:hypothetical protein